MKTSIFLALFLLSACGAEEATTTACTDSSLMGTWDNATERHSFQTGCLWSVTVKSSGCVTGTGWNESGSALNLVGSGGCPGYTSSTEAITFSVSGSTLTLTFPGGARTYTKL